MPAILYEPWKPGADAIGVVVQARDICEDYAQRGYDLTLRQLYYQFVARDLIPNTQRSYKRLGDIINRARMAGLLDWSYIEDRTRNLESLSHWDNPSEVVESAARSFGMDLWANQPTRVEIWVEKEALAGVIARAARRYDCAWFSCRGYVSQSEMWGAGQRIGRYIAAGQSVVVLHLGDHDPSGIDMSRDIEERVSRFVMQDWYNDHADEIEGTSMSAVRLSMVEHLARAQDATPDIPFELRRIALNMDQVEQYDPPPNPAKQTDARFAQYLREHGDESWELDALDPQILDDLITGEIEGVIDLTLYEESKAAQEEHREILDEASDRWDEVVTYLRG